MSDTPEPRGLRFGEVSEAYLEELDRLGAAIYEKLKPQLEPEYDRKFITFHVDTEDYAIGKNSSTATRAMLQRHPLDGRLYCRKIGNELEYGLATRIIAANIQAANIMGGRQ